ncbi:probable C-mannosyltransferase DPY19L1 [Sceloporus undulatus]|uniref:probable C-mannosyltransferase DPY19L1 n=1 Tax=Sceloporus undulatus TaxID=8520 RepID=UPI001C4C369F|nr:probable C-mannosyltransferase DPY19L1 [Sceloporus undulatus]XP_042329168.1 probable C-mannosyltransferase DPY19L1 [Sceloporus undulatus]
MLPWRFAQFVLLTQVASVFSIYILGFIDSSKVHKILRAHMASVAVCFVLMFGNSVLLTSYYTASLVICQGILAIRPIYLRTYKNIFPLWAFEAFSCLLGTIVMKPFLCLILGVTNHVYIINLIKAKLTNYKDFDTLMYTCAVEFDFMEKETPVRYMKTLLLPVVLAVFVAIVVKVFQHILHCRNVAGRQRDLKHGEMAYHAIQLIFFASLAILIMRLKLFLTPHMCIMASLICSKQLFGWIYHKIPRRTFVLAILALMAGEGIRNLQKDWSMVGEFSSLPQEELLLWIKANTKQDAVFGGTMPITSSVKLSTLRPVVNHPHYEDTVIPPKMKILYSMYSRKSAKEVKMKLLKMGINYYILEEAWCPKKPKSGCTMPEIWDVEDKSNAGKVPLCTIMSRDSRPYFQTVFSNSLYKVLEVSRE